MKKYIVSGILLLALLVPVFSFAETTEGDIDPNQNTSSCVRLNNNLRYQSRDMATQGEVSTLQDFLQSKSYLNSEPTGYFGLMTVAAVKSYQVASGISGTGYVGPLTRAKIAASTCTGDEALVPTSPTAPIPTNPPKSSSPGVPAMPVACTMEAKMCADGSYVGRSGPKCEFTKCPGEEAKKPPMQNDKPLLPPQEKKINTRATDDMIKAQLSSARAQAELYWDAGKSYAGVCTAKGGIGAMIFSALRGISPETRLGGMTQAFVYSSVGANGSAVCHDNANAWAAIVSLKTPTVANSGWCVDSTGASRESASLGASVTVCP